MCQNLNPLSFISIVHREISENFLQNPRYAQKEKWKVPRGEEKEYRKTPHPRKQQSRIVIPIHPPPLTNPYNIKEGNLIASFALYISVIGIVSVWWKNREDNVVNWIYIYMIIDSRKKIMDLYWKKYYREQKRWITKMDRYKIKRIKWYVWEK